MTEKDLWHYKSLTDKGFSNVDIQSDAFLCDNINCKNQNHSKDLCIIYEKILNCLIVSFFAIIVVNNIMSDQDGMNMCLNSMQRPKKLLKPGCYQGKLDMGLNVSVRNRQMQDSSMLYALLKEMSRL